MANMEESKLILNVDEEGPFAVFSKDKPPESLLLPQSTSFDSSAVGSASSAGAVPPTNMADSSSASAGPPTNMADSSSVSAVPPTNMADSSSVSAVPPTNMADSSSASAVPPTNMADSSSASAVPPTNMADSSSADPMPQEGSSPSTVKPDPKVVLHPQKQPRIPPPDTGRETHPFANTIEDQWKENFSVWTEYQRKMAEESSRSSSISVVEDSQSHQGEGRANADLKCLGGGGGVRGGTRLRRRQQGSLLDGRPHSRDTYLEVHTYGDKIKVVILPNGSPVKRRRVFHRQLGDSSPSVPNPIRWLGMISLVAYGFYVIPVPANVTAVIGVAFGLVLVFVLLCFLPTPWPTHRGKSQYSMHRRRYSLDENTDAETLQGWMNITHDYNPEMFQSTETHPVYVKLESSELNVSYSKTFVGVPNEREILHSHTYQMANSKVTLEPAGLARKRFWNKKYPIRITISEGKAEEESVTAGQEVEEGAKRNPLPVDLYLFANTGREKEEWFQHFQSASTMKDGEDSKISDTSQGDAAKESPEELQKLPVPLKAATRKQLDYRAYMTQLVGEGSNPAPDPGLGGKGNPTADQKGWMKVTHDYNSETFQLCDAQHVHARLDSSELCLSYPQTSDGLPHDSKLLHSHAYQLANCEVTLEPTDLAQKKVWNKKYPIRITLAEGKTEEESVTAGQEVEEGAKRNPLPVNLYLFANTGREKEEWFQHFQSASAMKAKRCEGVEEKHSTSQGDAAKESTEELQKLPESAVRKPPDYSAPTTQLAGSESDEKRNPTADQAVYEAQSSADSGPWTYPAPEVQPAWLNSLIGRIFWNFLQDFYWTDLVAQKFQKKLSQIKLPYFMNELALVDLDMGACLPQILSISKPTLDRRGLWLEVELRYTGCFQMTLQTKMNLCKLGKEEPEESQNILRAQQEGGSSSKPRMSTLADSDEESSSLTSSDEEDASDRSPVGAEDVNPGWNASRKILKFMDKIAKSRYFQKATENEYIRKKIAQVSNVPLMLSVEVLELSGTLAINIPPPPTDRIWYSFQEPPKLDLHVRPMFGKREVTFTQVTEWIERKLKCEFQNMFVMPNMNDVYVPLMAAGPDNPPAAKRSSSTSRQSSMEPQD
ncbi:testis-expressed protein 2-like isoform X2 [Entelurus aequoreus]|uniref:testis-expressed protein 2-like isoform X2 n=1 Tax=Entelurus aequoreus TaxID=161455 RepID=UPI002B1DEDFF|nr:testis-expressed protein 2-like isoform X2 [Entelurus aequoreus]